jgi:hypothetical protein
MDLAENRYDMPSRFYSLGYNNAHTFQLVMVSSLFFGVGSILAAVANSFTLVYVFAIHGCHYSLTSQSCWEIHSRNRRWWNFNTRRNLSN